MALERLVIPKVIDRTTYTSVPVFYPLLSSVAFTSLLLQALGIQSRLNKIPLQANKLGG